MTNIPLTVPVKVSVQDLTYKVNVSTAIQVVRADPYEGDYTVTPSLTEQILETNGKVMENDVTVHAMKKGLATLPIMSFVADPNISFDKTTGKITATVSGNEEITPQVEEGYISEGTPGKIGYFGNKTLKLDGLSGGTIRPRLYGDYTVRKYYYLTGDYVFKSVTVDGLTADKVVEGNVVRIGDELDPEHIMRVEGTAVVPSGTKQVAITKNGTVTEDVTRYENAEIITNVPASEVDTGTKSINSNGTHNVVGYATAQVAVPASEVDVGTKEITSNGTYDVVGFATADVAVPNSYSASDEGKVVSNGALVSQTSDTVTANDTYDTTLINSLTVNVSGGGGSGMPLLDVITVSENVRAFNLDLTPYHSFDMVFIISDVTLSASDWLYTVVNGSSPSGGSYTYTSLVNHRGLFAYMGKLAGRPTATEKYTGYATTGIMNWSAGYANNLYVYTYDANKTILAGSKYYIYGGNYADILQ